MEALLGARCLSQLPCLPRQKTVTVNEVRRLRSQSPERQAR